MKKKRDKVKLGLLGAGKGGPAGTKSSLSSVREGRRTVGKGRRVSTKRAESRKDLRLLLRNLAVRRERRQVAKREGRDTARAGATRPEETPATFLFGLVPGGEGDGMTLGPELVVKEAEKSHRIEKKHMSWEVLT